MGRSADVSSKGGVMGGSSNEVHVVTRAGIESWPRMDKAEVAYRLVAFFAARLDAGATEPKPRQEDRP